MLMFEAVPNSAPEPVGRVRLYRAKVPGGWLMFTDEQASITFVPYPDHSWNGASLA